MSQDTMQIFTHPPFPGIRARRRTAGMQDAPCPPSSGSVCSHGVEPIPWLSLVVVSEELLPMRFQSRN